MDPSVFVFQPYVVVATMVSVLVAAIAWLAFRARKKGEPPIITASLKELQKGWYQLSITVINRLPYQLFGVSLRRIRPRSARLMPPIISVSTKQGDFQVWSNPAVDKADNDNSTRHRARAPRGAASRCLSGLPDTDNGLGVLVEKE